ncbi:recombinase family protein [Paraburkholderia flagellata]|uniref:recombinase family protein n=1 Tax=Paraburkholderia flagellata TaxID=2883241 RepID=UPI001F2BE57D|nr:recombinase family protein [Paraburkholderia flagellata]
MLLPDISQCVRAAQYIRMSTDYQQYSTESQRRAIAEFAATHHIEIVATYEDAGKSGLSIRGRAGLQRLLADVHRPERRFGVVLVYDVSRWGRFLDADESAHYEFLCRQAGVDVIYCSEVFENDGSTASALLKTIKRAMASEYSRELSVKVYAGQCRLAEQGFWQGSSAGYGLQRILVDAFGQPKGPLTHGERKSLQTDHVIIAPGDPVEVALVQRMFDWYVRGSIGPCRIAARLNAFGLCNGRGQPWSPQMVGNLLRNEKYAGTNLYGRISSKLTGPWQRNPESEWVRTPNAFCPIVGSETFDAASAIRRTRTRFLSDEELLERLRSFAQSRKSICQRDIDLARTLPAGQTYKRRFGSVLNAYERVGYAARCHGMSPETFRATRQALYACVDRVAEALRATGRVLSVSATHDSIMVERELHIRFVVRLVRYYDCRNPRWRVRWPLCSQPDLLVVSRMDSAFSSPIDLFVFPRGSLPPGREVAMTLGRPDEGHLEVFRYPDERILLELTARSRLEDWHGYRGSQNH